MKKEKKSNEFHYDYKIHWTKAEKIGLVVSGVVSIITTLIVLHFNS